MGEGARARFPHLPGAVAVRRGRLLADSDVKEPARAPLVGSPGKLGRGLSIGHPAGGEAPGRLPPRKGQPVHDSAVTVCNHRYGFTTGGGETYYYHRNLSVNFPNSGKYGTMVSNAGFNAREGNGSEDGANWIETIRAANFYLFHGVN